VKKIFLLFVAFFLGWSSVCAGMDWKALHERADKEGAAKALSALGKNPASKDDLYVLGLVYLNEYKNKEAEAAFDKLLAQDPGLIEAKWGKTEMLRRKHELDKSRQMLEEIIKEDPSFSPAYISLAYIKYRDMDFTGCVRLASDVIAQGPENVDTTNYVRAYGLYAGGKGMLAHYGGPFSKVIDGMAVLPNLQKAQKIQPDSAVVLFGLGSYYLLAPSFVGRDVDKAGEYLKKALKADPKFVDIYVRLAQYYKIKGDQVKYNEYLKKALELDPQNEVALDVQSGACKFICP